MVSTYTSPKTWAYKESLSSADMNTYVRDNVIALKEQLPVGELIDIAYDGTPDGPFLHCDGSAYSRATYATLYGKVGTTWGVGDGSTTFNIPDGRGRVKMGAGTGSGLTARTVGQTLGEETHVLTTAEIPSHTHPQNSHAHTVYGSLFEEAGSGTNHRELTDSGFGSNNVSTASTTAVNQSEGGGGGHNNIQPTYVVKTFIRY